MKNKLVLILILLCSVISMDSCKQESLSFNVPFYYNGKAHYVPIDWNYYFPGYPSEKFYYLSGISMDTIAVPLPQNLENYDQGTARSEWTGNDCYFWIETKSKSLFNCYIRKKDDGFYFHQ
jgi:hypothetical protein